MWPLKDKLLLLLSGCLLLLLNTISVYSVTALLLGVTVSALNGIYAKRNFAYTTGIVYILVCAVRPEFTAFLPLVFYDVFIYGFSPIIGITFLPFFVTDGAFTSGLLYTMMILLNLSFSYLLCSHSITLERFRTEILRQRDNKMEIALKLERRNKDLMDKQDIEITLATLAERNRIAREIHDNVGHMISRSILQVGALMAVNKESVYVQGLSGIHQTLIEAMNSIRSSVHDLHDNSVDLYAHIKSIIEKFEFCPVYLNYDIEGEMGHKLKYTLISIIREALSNIAKHSKAKKAFITLREHPSIFQLIIYDNGQGFQSCHSKGIGLSNMEERVAIFDGNINIDGHNGFKIFISIPKGDRTA